MLKLLCLLVAASGVWGQSGLPYTQLLDTKYRISWGYTNETIEFQIDATTTGWISFALLSEDSKLLDIWWGGYDEEYRVNYGQDAFSLSNTNLPGYPDTFQNLQLIDVQQPPFNDTTRVRFSRPLSTGDFKQDVDILQNVRQVGIWSYSDRDAASSPSVASGVAQITFRPV